MANTAIRRRSDHRKPKKLNATRLSGVEFDENGLKGDTVLQSPPSQGGGGGGGGASCSHPGGKSRSPSSSPSSSEDHHHITGGAQAHYATRKGTTPITTSTPGRNHPAEGHVEATEEEDEEEWGYDSDGDRMEDWNWGWAVAGLGSSIPNKLREIHDLLMEDDVDTPQDELVKPMEGILSQGLEAINLIGRTALAVGTSVDNAIEGALTLVQNAGDYTMRATATLDSALLGQRPSPSNSPATSPSSSSKNTGRAVGGGTSSSISSSSRSNTTSEAAIPLHPSFSRHRSVKPTGAVQQPKNKSSRAKPPLSRKSSQDALLEYERKAFRLEQMLAELRDELVHAQVESPDVHSVVCTLTSSLRQTQAQCQAARKQQDQNHQQQNAFQERSGSKTEDEKDAGAAVAASKHEKGGGGGGGKRWDLMEDEEVDEDEWVHVKSREVETRFHSAIARLDISNTATSSTTTTPSSSSAPRKKGTSSSQLPEIQTGLRSKSLEASSSKYNPRGDNPRRNGGGGSGGPVGDGGVLEAGGSGVGGQQQQGLRSKSMESARPTPIGGAEVPEGAQEDDPTMEDPAAKQMRLQMEALLSEKARLAEENQRLARENDSLHELLDFHHQACNPVGDYEDEELFLTDQAKEFSIMEDSIQLVKGSSKLIEPEMVLLQANDDDLMSSKAATNIRVQVETHNGRCEVNVVHK